MEIIGTFDQETMARRELYAAAVAFAEYQTSKEIDYEKMLATSERLEKAAIALADEVS